MLRRGLNSPELEELDRRAEYFEMEQRRRNRAVVTMVLLVVVMAIGGILAVLATL